MIQPLVRSIQQAVSGVGTSTWITDRDPNPRETNRPKASLQPYEQYHVRPPSFPIDKSLNRFKCVVQLPTARQHDCLTKTQQDMFVLHLHGAFLKQFAHLIAHRNVSQVLLRKTCSCLSFYGTLLLCREQP